MKIKNKYIMILFLFLSLILSGCNETKEEVNVYNWGDYIDKEVIKEFEKEYNIKVNYDTYATNEDLYVKTLQKSNDFDLIFPSDYMVERMSKEGLLEEINYENIPNYKYIREDFKKLEYDREEKYSIPYMWGTLGIVYNKNEINENINSWKVLWDEKYKDEIIMLNSQRDTFAIALLKLGYSINTRNIKELEEAKTELIKQKPLIYAYLGDELKDVMVAEEAKLAVAWSGDGVAIARENPNMEYIIPKEGTNLWFDTMAIPKGSKNKENAEKLINFLCRPEIAAKNGEYIEYSIPIPEGVKLLSKELRNSKIAYPDLMELSKLEVFKDPKDILPIYDEFWTEIMSE